MSKVAFVGVGRMGANMARHLQLDCGHDITAVYDVNKEASAELAAELDAKDCSTLAEVTEAAEIIFTVVTNDDAMRAIFLGEGDNLLVDGRPTQPRARRNGSLVFPSCTSSGIGLH